MSAAAVAYSNINEGYLKTSHNIRHDYAETKVGGQSDILSEQASRQGAYGDWRDQFFKNGYTVIKGAISRERAEAYRKTALEWFQKFPFGFDINNKETWKEENLPVLMNGGMVLGYSAAHEKWVWEARRYELNLWKTLFNSRANKITSFAASVSLELSNHLLGFGAQMNCSSLSML